MPTDDLAPETQVLRDRDAVPPAPTDPAELVVFNMADAARPGAVTHVETEDGVQAYI